MDLMTAASSIATLVSLLGQFRGERQTVKEEDYKEFLNLLDETRHNELKTLIESNQQASDSIKKLLYEDRNVLLEKIESLDKALAQFASGFEGFSQLVEAVKPTDRLSSQALNLLRLVEEVKGNLIMVNHFITGIRIWISGSHENNTPVFNITEPRFIEDDISTLLDLRLIKPKEKNIYLFTRVASELVRSMKT
jgi:hypothetical protein